jgi:AraC-like DNA-binding protein
LGAIKIQCGAGGVKLSMRESLTIDTAPVLGHFRALAEYGVPHKILEEILGMTKASLEIKDARVPFLNNIKMIEKGIEMIGPEIPLKLGSLVSLENMGACGFIFKNCKNLEEVTHQFLRYQKLLYAVSDFTATHTKHTVIIAHAIRMPLYQRYNRILVELAFSAMITAIQALIGKEISIRELRFTHKKPDYVGVYQEIFKAPLRFNQKADMVVLDKGQLDVLILDSHIYIKDTLIQHANDLLTEVESDAQFKDEVKGLVLANLHKGNVDIEMISEKLNMSRWTMTRKLKKEGVTFKHLMNTLKMKAAMNYLESPNLSIMDIAFLLGYSETSVFSRAFKSWTGENPSEFKRDNSKRQGSGHN